MSGSADHAGSGSGAYSFPDGSVVFRLKRGDEGALREIVQAYWHPLVRYACMLLGDVDSAKDVVQECLARLWEERQRCRITVSLRGHLYRMVHNRSLAECRRMNRRHNLMQRHWNAPASAEPALPLDDALPAILRHALDRLPPRRRHVFVLAHLHDLTYKQIGRILDISPQTVANLVSAALADLRRELAPHAAELLDEHGGTHGRSPLSSPQSRPRHG